MYLLFQQMLLESSFPSEPHHHDGVRVYIKTNVERFLFKGADLMWPGVLTVSTRDFKQNAVAVVYAHKALISDYISTLAEQADDEEEEMKEGQGEEGETPQTPQQTIE